MNKIRNAEQARHLLKGIDKYSEGWATVTTRTIPRGPARTETWSAQFNRSIAGWYLAFARREHGKRCYPHWAKIPPHVTGYLATDEATHKTKLTLDDFRKLRVGEHGILSLRWIRPEFVLRVKFQLQHQPTRTCEGILVGAEVGESGDGPSEFLPFPTTEQAVLKAVGDAVEYANNLAVETGWKE